MRLCTGKQNYEHIYFFSSEQNSKIKNHIVTMGIYTCCMNVNPFMVFIFLRRYLTLSRKQTFSADVFWRKIFHKC